MLALNKFTLPITIRRHPTTHYFLNAHRVLTFLFVVGPGSLFHRLKDSAFFLKKQLIYEKNNSYILLRYK